MGIIGLKQLDNLMVHVHHVTRNVKYVEMLPILNVLNVMPLLCIYKQQVNPMGYAMVVIQNVQHVQLHQFQAANLVLLEISCIK